MTARALLDSNVLIAILAEAHEHHQPSLDLINQNEPMAFAVAVHSFAECYNTLTRRGPRAPFEVSARAAWLALRSLRDQTELLGLTPARTFDAIGVYAATDGVGPRLYDRLFGEVALAHRIETIITWNVGHMRTLFPALMVADPNEVRSLWR